jgi:hypothetical protein
MSEALDNVFLGSENRGLLRMTSPGGEPMPADDSRARSTSSQRGRRAEGVGDPQGAADSSDLDFSGCLALSWPGKMGLEEMLLATGPDGSQAPLRTGPVDSADRSGPEAAELAAPASADRPAEELEATPADASPSVPLSELAGRVVEEMLPGPGLAGWLSCAEVGNLSEFELAGVAAACRRLANWATAAELTAVAEMTTRAAARDSAVPVGPDGRPALVSQEAVAEVGLALTMSHFGAALWTDLAMNLRWRLPGTLKALSEGRIDLSRARLMAEFTSVLSDADARSVEDRVLGKAEHQTTGRLRAALRRAVISVDPAAAERRREEAERRARVGLHADEEGTATLSGHNLPGVQACAAMARITALAQAMKAAGAAGGIDLLRAQVLIGLLLNTLPGIPPPLEDPAAPGPVDPDHCGPNGQSADDPPDQGPNDLRDRPGGGGTPQDGGGGSQPDHDSGSPPDHGSGSPTDTGNGSPTDTGNGSPTDTGNGSPTDTGSGGPPDGYSGGPPDSFSGGPPDDKGGSPADRDLSSPPDDDNGDPADTDDGPGDLGANSQETSDPPDERNSSRPPSEDPQVQPAGGRDGQITHPGHDSWRKDAHIWDRDPPDGFDDDVGGDTWNGHPQRDASDLQTPTGPVPAWPRLPTGGDVEMPTSGCPPGRAGRMTMKAAWRALAGTSPEPGIISWLGPITPNAARQLAETAAGDPRTEWRVIVTDHAGRTVTIARVPRRDLTAGGGGTGFVSRITLTLSRDLVESLAPTPAAVAESCGSTSLGRVLAAALTTARRAIARVESLSAANGTAGVATGKALRDCGHPDCEAHYRPSDRLRELVVARDQTCRFPGCRQPAWQADLDHTIAFDDGGPTCRCNLGPACRRHHQIKQRPGWHLEQPEPGIFEWTTPAGRRYLVVPDPHPV